MLSFSQNVNRDWEDEFTSNMARGYAPGATINIKKPPRYMYRAGRVAVPQATTETTVPLTLSQGGCDISSRMFEKTLQLTKLEDKVAAAMAPVANEIDRQGLALAHYSTYNTLNAAGALPTTQALAVAAATARQSAPRRNGRAARQAPGVHHEPGAQRRDGSGLRRPLQQPGEGRAGRTTAGCSSTPSASPPAWIRTSTSTRTGRAQPPT
jgi:hypothetical protein